MRLLASALAPRRSSSPSSGWTCAPSPPQGTWCHGPSCAHAPSSPAPSTARAPPARATPTSGLRGVLGEAAAAAAKTDTFLGERYRRLVKRRGKLKALVAVARSILVIIWHLLADPAARYHDLGAGYWADRIDTGKKARNHIRQLEALGFTVSLAPAA